MAVRSFCRIIGLVVTLALSVVPSTAQTSASGADPVLFLSPDRQKAKKSFEKAQAAERAGQWLAAFESYGKAVCHWPWEETYVRGREATRLRLVQQHVDRAEQALLAGRYTLARSEFLAALGLDPGYSLARERLEQLPPSEQQAPTRSADQPEQVRIKPRPGTRTLDYRGDTRGAYEEVARQFGVTASFDPELTLRQIRFRVSEVDFATAMRLLEQQTRTFWRALDEGMFFVADDTQAKRLQYAPTVEQTIHLPELASADRMTESIRLLNEIIGGMRAQFDTRTRTLTLRGSPESLALAAKLLEHLEQARGEVLLEVEILEVDRAVARRLGIIPPASGRVVTPSPQDVREAQESLENFLRVVLRLFGTPPSLVGLTPEQIAALIGAGQLSQFALVPPLIAFGGGKTIFLATLPGAVAEFSEVLRAVRQGQRMLLRAEDGTPASFFVGERFPVNLGRLGPSFLDPLLIPALREGSLQAAFPAFQYEDLGLKVRATPRLHGENEVTLQLQFEIRARTATEVNRIPVISNRTVEQTLRLKENETTVIAGILQQEERRGIQGWPGLGQTARLGHLTARRDTDTSETELFIFLTPRRVRQSPRLGLQIFAGREPAGASVGPRPPQ